MITVQSKINFAQKQNLKGKQRQNTLQELISQSNHMIYKKKDNVKEICITPGMIIKTLAAAALVLSVIFTAGKISKDGSAFVKKIQKESPILNTERQIDSLYH